MDSSHYSELQAACLFAASMRSEWIWKSRAEGRKETRGGKTKREREELQISTQEGISGGSLGVGMGDQGVTLKLGLKRKPRVLVGHAGWKDCVGGPKSSHELSGTSGVVRKVKLGGSASTGVLSPDFRTTPGCLAGSQPPLLISVWGRI